MKRKYMQPLFKVMLIATEPLMALSQEGTAVTVTFETYDTEEDASEAASRTFSVWDED